MPAPPVDPAEAYQMAARALQDGDWDPRTADGARQNALTSIAWSLLGILGQMQLRDGAGPGPGEDGHRRPGRRAHADKVELHL